MKTFIESLIPGVRDARTPFVTGLLWFLFLWIAVADGIPDRADATGFTAQAYGLADHLGPGGTIAAFGVVAYIVGILGVSLADGLLAAFRGMLRVSWIRRLIPVAQLLPVRRDEGQRRKEIAEQAVMFTWKKGINDELQRTKATALDGRFACHGYAKRVKQLIEQDIGTAPLEALRAVDPGLHQEVDRERSEREFRLAVMPPAALIGIFAFGTTSLWGYLGALVAVACWLRAAVREEDLATKILRLLILTGAPLPTLQQVDVEGAPRGPLGDGADGRGTPSRGGDARGGEAQPTARAGGRWPSPGRVKSSFRYGTTLTRRRRRAHGYPRRRRGLCTNHSA